MKTIERILGWVGALFKGAVSHEYYFPMKRGIKGNPYPEMEVCDEQS